MNLSRSSTGILFTYHNEQTSRRQINFAYQIILSTKEVDTNGSHSQ